MHHLHAAAWHLRLVNAIRQTLIEAFAQQRGARAHALERRREIVGEIARHRRPPQLDLPLSFSTCSGTNGIQCSGTVVMMS